MPRIITSLGPSVLNNSDKTARLWHVIPIEIVVPETRVWGNIIRYRLELLSSVMGDSSAVLSPENKDHRVIMAVSIRRVKIKLKIGCNIIQHNVM